MRCAHCGFDNPQEMKFCGECGTSLQHRCPQCGSENPPRFRFCGTCGTPLSGGIPDTQSTTLEGQRQAPTSQSPPSILPTAQQPQPEAERRQLTVLFCDLVDSTSLSTQLDPEELRDVVRAYQQVCAEVIQRFEGHIAQYLGDGLLVYFGYPQAHEDDGQRAVRAALGMVEAMKRLNGQLQQERGVLLAVRLGIHTGLVVVGEIGGGRRREQLALGETPNVAARLQGLAAPDTVVISAATHRLVQGAFTCQALGSQQLKGVTMPVPVYRVLRERDPQTRLDAAGGRGLTPLVGREQELALLLERWLPVKDGIGQVVLLSGEAGIGKSRLVQVLKERLAGEPHTRLEARGSPYFQQSALYPVMQVLHRLLRWRPDDPPQEKLRKLERTLERRGFVLRDIVPLFATLLALPLPDSYPVSALTPQRQKQRTLEALLQWLLQDAEQQPVLLIMEDLHWFDPSTLEFLTLVLDQAATMRLFALLTFRPTFRPPWGLYAHVTHLTLNRLPRRQTAHLLEQVTGGKALPAEVHRQLLTKTDGVPLFVEELTKMVLESGWVREAGERYELTGPLPPLAIPSTLHDSLMARLDRLGPAKMVAQLGATIGRRFSYEILQAVSPMDDATLLQALERLVEAELLYRRGLPPRATYLFKHALIQEAAYQSLLKNTRQHYHQRIAQVLDERFPVIVETQPELLAHHYTEAGQPAQAVPYWLRAGQRASERSANIEAVSQLSQGLAVLQALPATPARAQQELALQLALGAPLLMIKGHSAPEVEQAYTRALELCQREGDSPHLFSTLTGLWRFYYARGRLETTRELAEQCFALAQRMQDQARLQEAHTMLGLALFTLGELVAARRHLEQGIALYDPQRSRSLAFSGGTDPGVCCLSGIAWTLWTLGYPDRALVSSQEALTLAQRLSHAYSLGFALHYDAMLHKWRREPQLVHERAAAVMALSSEHGFARWLAGGMVRQGWSLAVQGSADEGIALLSQGLATWRNMGGELGLPNILGILAEAYGRGGRVEDGLDALAEALAIAHKNAERHYEAELYRLTGELLLQQAGGINPDPTVPQPTTQVSAERSQTAALRTEAETCFLQALEVARHQQAKSLELRAAQSLSRLWQQQGKRLEARQLLAEIYGWFTEGFDTPDLQEAKSLLDALA